MAKKTWSTPKEEFVKEVVDWWKPQAEIFYDTLHSYFTDDIAKIYRKMVVKSVRSIDWKNIGVYWSFTKKRAYPYWREEVDSSLTMANYSKWKDRIVLLEAVVNAQDIDVEEIWTWYHRTNGKELDCRLKNNIPILITAVNGEEKSIKANSGKYSWYDRYSERRQK